MELRPLLKSALLDKSVSKDIDEAVNEWEEVSEYHEDWSDTCICGKENIKYCFEIRNVKNNERLYPIGSQCIKHFGNVKIIFFTIKIKNMMVKLMIGFVTMQLNILVF